MEIWRKWWYNFGFECAQFGHTRLLHRYQGLQNSSKTELNGEIQGVKTVESAAFGNSTRHPHYKYGGLWKNRAAKAWQHDKTQEHARTACCIAVQNLPEVLRQIRCGVWQIDMKTEMNKQVLKKEIRRSRQCTIQYIYIYTLNSYCMVFPSFSIKMQATPNLGRAKVTTPSFAGAKVKALPEQNWYQI